MLLIGMVIGCVVAWSGSCVTKTAWTEQDKGQLRKSLCPEADKDLNQCERDLKECNQDFDATVKDLEMCYRVRLVDK